MAANRLWRTLSRKRIDDDQEGKGELARVLNIFDLTALGVGATLGLGVYVLAGSVAKETAGPAVCISFLIAAIASAFAGMCYAEFASRVPKAGSAYVYSYVTVGEFIAFVIGWNLILEYVIGTASVARGLSNYIDALIGNVMGKTLQSIMPIEISFLSEYPDFFAFGMVMLLALLLSMGVKESSFLNNVFTVINLLTILIVIAAGSIKADPKNWFISIDDIPKNVTNAGTGGFMPFGITGVMTGAAKCFYGFVGFDAVATTGEEAKKPQRNIPLAIVLSLIIILAAYFSISTVLTMMWPYYDQNPDAPFPYVFQQIGWPVIQWIVNIGAIFALCTSLLGAMFPLPRILYAMASDGIIFMWLSKVHSKTMTPILGTILSGLLAGTMALFFNLHQLIDMMSIGTLLAYTVVAISVLILRYQKENDIMPEVTMNGYEFTAMNIFKQTFNLNNHKDPSHISSIVSKCSIASFTLVLFILIIISNYVEFDITNGNVIVFVIIIILAFILILNLASIGRQPVQQVELSFKVPFLPLIPCCSIFINLYLMLQLDMFTWIRFIVWMLIGFSIYIFYGISHSVQGKKNKIELNIMKQKNADQSGTITKF
ncbi:cationic amino acid transporter 3-like [Vespa mandarinia]|uniref:cationic amino acid transporter 3-like n=1 Tax=Vespa mandarinia TaxID=7446 RepID=UPI001610C554|nr:cationic amino acid transporter 3-like [Vespa mandarinia]XP_035733326.1 cationic amino acid transporter 3-like [Vespa mandarinia]XP_035733328.1 cationic amino acid transporter 3-like [Vespa mandarinia]XP_035733329.1 cationic amino acid transporter 3-like [Vespa mandarinia]XP_035733330.1 cationic amino acid transporter 3-like [Vespa mandarinia]